MHFDIENGKVWIRANGTELDVGEALVERGVPKEDLVGCDPAGVEGRGFIRLPRCDLYEVMAAIYFSAYRQG